jgi:hypothetical protein
MRAAPPFADIISLLTLLAAPALLLLPLSASAAAAALGAYT